MKKLIALILVVMLLVPTVALASDITNAKWYGIITASNENAATDDVFTTFSLGTQDLIDADFLSANLTDCAMHDTSGLDTAFMPAVDNATPWCFYVNHIGEDAFKNYILYTGGNADMDGKIRYFPAAGGMTALDDATLELSDNFTIEQKGWIDTDNGTDKNLVYKQGAIKLYVSPTVSENITADIMGWSGNFTETLRPDGHNICVIPAQFGCPVCNDHYACVDDPGGGDGNATYVKSNDFDGAVYTDFYTLDNTSTVSTDKISEVRVYIRGVTLDTAGAEYFRSDLKLNGNITTGTARWSAVASNFILFDEALARPGGGNWQQSDLDDLLIGVTIKDDVATVSNTWVTQTYIVVTYQNLIEAASITATDVSSGEHTVRVTYLPNLLDNGNFEVGDPPDDWVLTGDGASVNRDGVTYKVGSYSANVTRVDNDCWLYQDIPSYLYYRGREVTFGAWVYATIADRVRIGVSDGIAGTAYTAWHNGDSTWQWLAVSHTMDAGSTQMRVQLQVGTGNTSGYIDGAILVEGDSIPDFNTFRIFVDNVEKDKVYTEVGVPDNSNDWTFFQNLDTYWHYLKIWKSTFGASSGGGGVHETGKLVQHIEWEYNDTTFHDRSYYGLRFDGVNDVITVAGDPSLDFTEAITLSAWVNPTGEAPISGGIICHNFDQPYEIVASVAGFFYVQLRDTDNVRWTVTSNISLTDGVFQYITGTWRKSEGIIYLYHNGASAGSGAGPTKDLLAQPAFSLSIGDRAAAHTAFGGVIDEARVYNRFSSSTEVIADYNGGVGSYQPYDTTGLVGWWHLEENGSLTATDSSGEGNDGTITGALWVNGHIPKPIGTSGINDVTPTFRTASSDADVSAVMASFEPIEEAQAPAWVLEAERDFWDTENITATGTFTTTPTPTAAPGVDIIVAISEASGTPSQLPFNVIAGFVILAMSLTATWFLAKYGSRNLWLKIIFITILMAVCVAVKVFDFWMIVFFLIMAIAIALFSRQRSSI